MERLARLLLWQIFLQQSSVHSYSVPADASNPSSVVVSVQNVSAALGSLAVLPCQSQRMVWTQDRLNDRQRVVHWDLLSSYYGDGRTERLCDMYSAGEQRVYSSYNRGRIRMPDNAFTDGNFSLVIEGVAESDAGTYSCNLHHHYCHLYETVKVQLVVTKRAEEASEYWDGEKPVLVAAEGSTVTLPCVNRQHIWTERHSEEEQQVVHWDRQPPGVPHDRADRLVDLYASGERRSYGPQFLRQKMNVSGGAFAVGDFSLRIWRLESADEGTYSCHLHHHYCGLHERRIYRLLVTRPAEGNGSARGAAPPADPPVVRGHNVINVIIPEGRMHFFQQLGYILATLLLFLVLLIVVVLVTRRRRHRGEARGKKCGKRGKIGKKSGKKGGKKAEKAEKKVEKGGKKRKKRWEKSGKSRKKSGKRGEEKQKKGGKKAEKAEKVAVSSSEGHSRVC
ncbi:matrix remodeling-associated protein 8 isoform X1 [Malurus melanocephalus]|uniref:matrix remodeling-associated protein 8 isoform X1 n=1 Tax=Malurus melanocephalus TaxID=175006 RepID=UPI0025489B54|nr:matrix remodeling-associated protein 8 isoform X1 [Malurus melanocephalus]